ncbi:hypothetical protein [Burkholderia sp. PU8-34]
METDIGIVLRDLGIADASVVRLQRARDRLVCVQWLLEQTAMAVTRRAAGRSRPDDYAESDGQKKAIAAAMREAVELLAREWPDDYPAGAVEWLLAER